MKHLLIVTCVVLGLMAVSAPAARANLVLSISSSDTLTNLNPGDTITVNVELSDLTIQTPPDDSLSFLSGEVHTDPTIFTINPVTAGTIIPAGGAAGFVGTVFNTPAQASAGGIYDWFNPAPPPLTFDPIITDGLFFSFTATVKPTATAGATGTFFFDPLSLGAIEGLIGFDPVDVDNGTPAGLAFSIAAAGGAIPEPSTLTILGLAAPATLLLRRRGRKPSTR